MIHLGDITKIHGDQIEPVDVVPFGSPCQDLSVAGKRAGLAGERSGLFMETVRIIKEMRESTNGIYPNIVVWENVPGAFSSNKKEDFRAVLEELVRIQEPDTTIPRPKDEKWNTSGAIVGDRWSLAWRVLDAQFWGVPQRRRRIALVMDFAGQSAPEILFERNGMQRNSAPCRKARKRIARDIKKSVGGTGESGRNCLTPWDVQSRRIYTSDGTWPALYGGEGGGRGYVAEPAYCLQGSMIGRADKNGPQGNGINEDVSFTLNATDRHAVAYGVDAYNHTTTGDKAVTLTAESGSSPTHSGPMVAVPYGICSYASNSMKSDNPHSGIYIADTSRTLDVNGGNPACNQGGIAICEPCTAFHLTQTPISADEVSPCLSAGNSKNGQASIGVCEPQIYDARGNGDGKVAPTMTGDHQNRVTDYTGIVVSYGIGNGQADQTKLNKEIVGALNCMHDQQSVMVAGIDCRNLTESQELYPTMQAKNQGGWSLNYSRAVRIRYRVRRLTPLECERLQGYPDNWTELPEISNMTDDTYNFWCQLIFEQAVRDEKARLNTKTGVYEVWRYVKRKADDESDVKPVGYWENTNKPYKHKTKQQMIKWYNSSFTNLDRTDSARYKALGNSIALPPWKWVLKRISAQFERDATLGSLFDGIGGFPLIWEQLNGKGSARWASEIEPFPIAVTKYHFGEE